MSKLRFERPIIKKIVAGMPNKFGMKSEYEPITHIDGVSVNQLIEDYGSPVFILSEKTIRETYNEAKTAFSSKYPKVQFAWSYKTNYLNAVCKIYHKEGSWAEVVSGFEYEKALSNGVNGNKIIFNGPDKSVEDLELAIKNGSLIHIDHFDEFYTILELTERLKETPKVAIRINMDTGIYPQWSRFGFNYDNGEAWDALNRIMVSGKMELVGLHSHIGTYVMTASAYGVAATKMTELTCRLYSKYNHVLKYIDLGGGFASKNTLIGAYLPGTDTTPSFDDYADAITTALLSSDIKQENLPMLILETGRALIDDAGSILGTVLANKRLADGNKTLIIDVGVNMLFTSFWYEHKITPAKSFSLQTENTKIYGPLCMNIDVIRENIDFPPLKKGDKFVISRIGAYNMTQWMQFITYRPNIVLIDMEGKSHIVRQNETLDSIVRNERTPEHLK
jgi:diaminopimelate decarboxylase